MSKPEITQNYICVFKIPTKVPELCLCVETTKSLFTGNVYFPSPFPTNIVTLDDLSINKKALEQAQVKIDKGDNGNVPERNRLRTLVRKNLRSLQSHAQWVADQNLDIAQTIITSVGMKIKTHGLQAKPDFIVEHGDLSGTLKATTKALTGKAAWEWQISTDGINYTSLPTTVTRKTLIEDLKSGVNYHIRYRIIRKNGPNDWSNALQIIAI